MDDDGRVAERRRLISDHAALKLLKAIAERDAAILERNNALADNKALSVERDAALLRSDLAFAERDSALVERDTAVAALSAARAGRVAAFSEWNGHALPNLGSPKALYGSTFADGLPFAPGVTPNVKDIQKDLRVKRKLGKDFKHGLLSSRKKSPDQKSLRHPGYVEQNERGNSVAVQADGRFSSSIPFCSCTGVHQPCYKWGNGGWQSACCTTMISMYPLPMNPKKRSSRLAGRKMSAGAFEKLLEKLTVEGVNVKCPIDLKDHWAKHGTNRYVILR